MPSEPKKEIEQVVDDILAKLDARLRQPLNEITSFFEWLRGVKFKSFSAERIVAAALSSDMAIFDKSMFFSEAQVKALSEMISTYRQQIAKMAKSSGVKADT